MKKMMPSEVYAGFKAGVIDADKGVDGFSEKLQEEKNRQNTHL